MAKGRKSSLDVEEPVVVQGNVDEQPIVAVEEEIKEETKAETQTKAMQKSGRKGVMTCVM